MSVLGFETEWYDANAGAAKKLYLKYFLENSTIEILEDKGAFLKRISYPGVRVNDLYVGSSICVFNRIIKIKTYANSATARYMGSREVHFISIVTASDGNKLGRFFNLAKSYQLSVGRVRTTSSTVSLHGIEFGAGDIIVETVGVNGADIEGFTAAASSLNPSGITMALNVDKIQELMGLYVPIAIPDDCTLCLIKPHIMKDHLAGDVLGAIVEQGFQIVGLHSTHFTPQIAEDLLDVYKGVHPQYSAMIEQLAESPLLAVMIMGSRNVVTEFREFCGPLNPDLARSVRPASLRALFGKTVTKNAVHCTDLTDDGELECGYMFQTVASLEVQNVPT